MGGGAAQRRRIKNFERANVSLHKAAQGKGKASMPLPAAPTKDDYRDKMPASLRKMLALKEVTGQPAKRRKLDPAGGLQQQQQSLRGQQGAGASSTQADAPQQQPQRHNKQQQQQQEGAQQQQQQAAQNASAAWQQPKKLKQKKKEYLNAKKLKKKGKKGRATNGAAAAAAEDDDVELPSDRVAFGEVVHAPPQVALKSKHWAANTQQQQQQQHSSGKKQKLQHPPKQQDEELEQMREQLIETYRSGRPAPQEGQATLKTLKALVKKQQGGG